MADRNTGDTEHLWGIGATNEWLTCKKCKLQTYYQAAMSTGCFRCGNKYIPAPTPPSLVQINHKFNTTRENKPLSTKQVSGVYNVVGNPHRKTPVEYTQEPPPKPPGHVRIVCVSDTHNLESKLKLPDGDILIHAGDFTMKGEPEAVDNFSKWLGSLPHKHKIVVAGNHDVTFHTEFWNNKWRGFSAKKYDSHEVINKLTNCTYLLDSETTVEGIRIYGSPWQPEFCDWAFNVVGEEAIKKYWDKIPQGIDVLVTHGPPIGHGGVCLPSRVEAGCPQLLKAIERTKPKLHVAGHIHEGYGASSENGVIFVNASSVNLDYNVGHNPIVIDIKP